MARVSRRDNPFALMVLVWLGVVLYSGFQVAGIWTEIGVITALIGALVLGLRWLESHNRTTWVRYLFSFFVALLSTALYYLVKPAMPHVEFLYTLAILFVSARWGLVAGLVTAFFSTVGNWGVNFFTDPASVSEAMMQGIFFVASACVMGWIADSREKALTAQIQMTSHLEQTYQSTLSALASALDARDRETAGHSARVTALAVKIAQEMKMDDSQLCFIRWGALIHDIGKIGVADAILRKPGSLNEAEWAEMRRHPEIGYAMLKTIPFLRLSLDVVRHHHERYDGKGYPLGLAGETIPLAARIFSVADTYDAMTSDRPYRKARSRAEALAEIRQLAGTQFDPHVVGVFLALLTKSSQSIGVLKSSHSADDLVDAR
ncbi:MAG: HD domain-containing protein [Chloroflexi bacterium]|nr:HD domain-containing protein [Chloroflexota bacterium]